MRLTDETYAEDLLAMHEPKQWDYAEVIRCGACIFYDPKKVETTCKRHNSWMPEKGFCSLGVGKEKR